jgi:hypothetical protein
VTFVARLAKVADAGWQLAQRLVQVGRHIEHSGQFDVSPARDTSQPVFDGAVSLLQVRIELGQLLL